MAKGSSPNRMEMMTEGSLELQKGRKTVKCVKIGINIIDYPFLHDFFQSWWIVEAKIITPFNVEFNICRGNR